jgi:hypothetical protein
MNDLASFLGLSAVIFTAITALLAYLSHLEASLPADDAESDERTTR